MPKFWCKIAFVVLGTIVGNRLLFAQEANFAGANCQTSLFDDTTLLHIKLEYNMDAVSCDVGDNPSEHQGQLFYKDQWGGWVPLNVEVSTRGIFRKNPANCNFPPLMLRFNGKETKSTIFSGTSKLKLVGHCQNGSKRHQEYLLKEYLAYKIYNLITSYSFRVRLAKISYINSFSADTLTRFAFFVEPKELMAKRLDGFIVEQKNIHPNATNRQVATLMAIFQYFIGNTDWSIKAQHNVVLVGLEPSAPTYPIPFDFDFSGMVNASYAQPAEALPIRSVRQRYFNGYCRTPNEYNQVLAVFLGRKQEIYDLIYNFPHLSNREKGKIIAYFDDFYFLLTNTKKSNRAFVKQCRTD